MTLTPEELIAIVGLGGVAIGALPSLIISFINRRAEDRHHFSELVFKAAIESWKFIGEKSTVQYILPLEHYIIHTAKMCEFALSGEKVTPETIVLRLKEVDAVMKVLAEHAYSISSNNKPHA